MENEETELPRGTLPLVAKSLNVSVTYVRFVYLGGYASEEKRTLIEAEISKCSDIIKEKNRLKVANLTRKIQKYAV